MNIKASAKPLVSVIIPLYNSEKYIAKTIQSALAQTWTDKEIIIVDDGSTDNSLAVAKTFEAENVKVFHQANKGASAARNKGLHEAKGDYIQFLDADDLLSNNKFEEQVELLLENPGYICTGPTVYFIENEDHLAKDLVHSWMSTGSADPVNFLINMTGGDLIGAEYGGMVAVHSWLCPKDILQKAGNWDERLSMDDDGEYFFRVILASKGILYAENAVSYYRQHLERKSLSATLTGKGYQSMLDAVGLKHQHLSKAAGNKKLVDKIFSRLYSRIAVDTYPHFKQHSELAIKMAKTLGGFNPEYKAGPISNRLTKILGWRLMRFINYHRHGL